MKFISILFLAAWFALAATDAAHAGFIGAAIGAIATAIGSLGIIGTALLNAAIGFALKLGVSLLTKASQKDQQPAGIKEQIQIGGDSPLSFIQGHFATPGQLVYANTYGDEGGTPNKYLVTVVSISDLPVNSLTGLWVNDTKCVVPDMSGTAPDSRGWYIDEFTDGSDHRVFIRFHDGTETAANSFLTSTFGSDPDRPFSADMIGRGVAYVVMTIQFDQELFSGRPTFVFETDGIKLYDIRKDTTAGGNGTQREDDPSTWAPSDNPIVQAYNIIRGIRYDGEWIYGGQTISAYQLPAANWMAAANACDLSITNKDGSIEKQFRSGGEITCDREPLAVIEDLLKGCNGRLAEIGGIFKVTVGAPGAPVYSFTDETAIVTEAQSFDPFPGLEDTVNGAHASYPEPDEKWASKDAPPYIRADLETEDDGRRMLADVQLPYTPYALQVQRILQAIVKDHRRFRQHQFFLPPEAWVLEPGDVVAWTSERNGYENKKFTVTSIDGGSNLIQGLSLKEVDPADYSWDAATDERPYSVGVLGEIVPPAQLITGWQVLPAVFLDDDGDGRRPSIEVFFAGGQVDVDYIRVQVRLASSQAIVFDGTIVYDAPLDQQYSVILNGVFLPNTDYEARGIYTSISGRAFTWSAWLTVTTPDVRIGGADLYPIGLGELAEDVKGYQEFVGQGLREFQRQLIALATNVADQDLGNFSDKQTLRRELVSTRDNITASYTEAIVVATGPGSALVARIEDLEVYVDDTVATAIDSLSAQISTVDGKTTANADAITALSATVDGVSASVTVRGSATVAPSGWSSRYGIEVRGGIGDDWSEAAFFLDAKPGLSRAVFLADQIILTNGLNELAPFAFIGGVGYLQNLKVEAADIVNLTVDWANITNVILTSADIGLATIETANIKGSQITGNAGFGPSTLTVQPGAGWTTVGTITFDNANPNPVLTYFKAVLLVSSSGSVQARVRRSQDGRIIRSWQSADDTFDEFFLDGDMLQGTNTYVLEAQALGSTGSANMTAVIQWNKR